MISNHYLDGLNDPQREAVINTEGPTMIIAGAGSGKTRVLTYRIAHLMEKGVEPFNILALTFTNKAASEMRQRIEKVVGNEAKNIWMGTFHSVFAKILRKEADKLNYPSDFTIYDTEDSKSLIKSILKELKLDDKVYKPSMVLARISSAKNRLVSVSEYLNNPIYAEDDAASSRREMGRIYKLYKERCFKAGAMDFDDLLFNTNVLFRNHLDVLNKYQQKFKYVMVDEYQDTNVSQYLIVKKLAAVHQNICVVGDDAQSIYAFRGADIQNILNFEQDYPDLKVFRLEQNYRSTQNIVEVANSIIKHNTKQLQKNVWTHNPEGNKIELIKAGSDTEEGKLVANAIFEAKMHENLHNRDFAILYRTNAQSRSMEEALRRINIKYRIVGGLSFYQRKEVKDLISYLRLVINPNDEEALKRVINLPKRGIGDTTITKLIVIANENDVPLWQIISNVHVVLQGRTATAIDNFAQLLKSFSITAQTKTAYEVADQVAKQSGLLRELYEDKTIEGLSRYENVQSLLNAIQEFSANPEVEDNSLAAFLQEVALITDADTDKDEDKDRVTLMTIHSAKGLEFKNVFVVGMEEGLFPSQMMITSRNDLEEERRLFYVAATRAEHKLTLTFATSRYRFGSLQSCEPSRFLEEIDSRFLKVNKRANVASFGGGSESAAKQGFKSIRTGATTQPAVAYVPSANFVPSDMRKLREGMKVEHLKFGFGTVKRIETEGANFKALVNFEGQGDKMLILAFAKLMIHSE